MLLKKNLQPEFIHSMNDGKSSPGKCSCCCSPVLEYKQKKKSSVWVKYYLTERHQYGEFSVWWPSCAWMTVRISGRISGCQFDDILHHVGPRIKRINTRFRRCICPAERLAICLRWVSTLSLSPDITYHIIDNRHIVSAFFLLLCIAQYISSLQIPRPCDWIFLPNISNEMTLITWWNCINRKIIWLFHYQFIWLFQYYYSLFCWSWMYSIVFSSFMPS